MMTVEQMEKRKYDFERVTDLIYIMDKRLNVIDTNTAHTLLTNWYKKIYGGGIKK